MTTTYSGSSVVLQRTSSSSSTRRPSLSRPTLPSLASWNASSSFTPSSVPQLNPPTSAGSTSSFEEQEAITPFDGPTFPAPPSTLKMPSTNPQVSKSGSDGDLNRAAFKVQPIPAFRGSKTPTEQTASAASSRPSTAQPREAAPPPPSSLTGRPDINSRRASVASVFSLPRQNPPSAPTPAPEPPSMGLGIAGCGVGGAKDALIIERLGETTGNGRRGSLKRVLVSEDEEDRDAHRSSTGGRDGERSQHNPEQQTQQTYSLPRRGSSSLAPPLPLQRRPGSSSPPQPDHQGGRSSPSNKRPRTHRSPLDSLAAAANLVRPGSSSSSISSSSTAMPELANLLSGPVPTNAREAAQLETARAMKEQDNERRRQAANSAPGSVGAALGKLRAEQAQEGESSSGGKGKNASGLAKRRGHRPPAVNTASSSSSSAGAAQRAHPYHMAGTNPDTLPPLRSAPVDIPSVLVGSPVDAQFAARAGRELPPMRTASAAQPNPGPHRRQSRSGAADRVGDPSTYPPVQHSQPPLVSNSTHYVRPTSVAFPPASTPSSAKQQQQHPPLPAGGHRVASYGSERRAPSPGTAYHPLQPAPGQYPPPHHQQHYSSSAGRPVSPHTAHPLSQPHSSASSSHPHPYPHHQPSSSQQDRGRLSPAFLPATAPLPPHTAPLAGSTSSSAALNTSSGDRAGGNTSKTAFLSLFSTFYDSLSDSRVLTSNLEGQIQRASSLLATLQNAEGVLERMVEEKVGRVMREVEVEREGRWRDVEERLRRVEEHLSTAPGGEREPTSAGADRRGSAESTDTALTSASLVEDRLDRIEKALQVKGGGGGGLDAPAPPMSASASRPSTAQRPESIMEESPSIVQQEDEKMREE